MDHSARPFNLLRRQLLQGLRPGGCGLQMSVLPPSGKRRPWGGRAKPRGTRAHPRPRFFTDFTLFGLKTKTAKKGCCKATAPGTLQAESRGGLTNGCLSRRVPGWGGGAGGGSGDPPAAPAGGVGVPPAAASPRPGAERPRSLFTKRANKEPGGERGDGWAAAAPVGGSEEARWDITPLASPLIRRKQVPRCVTH